ncbi:hypothetical protein C0991_010267, partial [Blastosporella zonata]
QMATAWEQCALNEDGTLKDAMDIPFSFDKDDDILTSLDIVTQSKINHGASGIAPSVLD